VDDADDVALAAVDVAALDALDDALLLLDELPQAASSTPSTINVTNPPTVRFNPDILRLLSPAFGHSPAVRASSKPRCRNAYRDGNCIQSWNRMSRSILRQSGDTDAFDVYDARVRHQ
jgi:hypothetical protein